MSSDDVHGVSPRWLQWRAATDLDEYFTRWRQLESSGQSPHGEADFIESFHPASVLDAGCGMGRVAIELAKRGIDVVGVDLDNDLLEFARHADPSISWVHADLATMRIGRRFEMVAMPGNVMVYCRPTDRAAVIGNCVAHLELEGLLVAGFQLEAGGDALTLGEYDEICGASHLELVMRSSTWHGDPYVGGSYAVSVHRNGGCHVSHFEGSLH